MGIILDSRNKLYFAKDVIGNFVGIRRIVTGPDESVLAEKFIEDQLIEQIPPSDLVSTADISDPPVSKRFSIDNMPIDVGYLIVYQSLVFDGDSWSNDEFSYVVTNESKYNSYNGWPSKAGNVLSYNKENLYKAGISAIADKSGNITDAEIAFYEQFKSSATDDQKSAIIKKIIDQKGLTSYLAANYPDLVGISLNDFKDQVEAEVQRRIDDRSVNLIAGAQVAVTDNQVEYEYEYILGSKDTFKFARRLQDSNETRSLIERTLRPQEDLGTEQNRATLQESELYQGFQSYALGFKFYRPQSGNIYYDDLVPLSPSELGMKYITSEEGFWYQAVSSVGLAGLGDPELVPMEDVYKDYYLQFSDEVKQRNTQLGAPLADLEDLRNFFVNNLVTIVFPRFLDHFESILRESIAQQIQTIQEEDQPIEEDDVQEILQNAEKEAQKDAQGIADQAPPEKPQVSDETIDQRQKLYKQCVLLLNLPDLIEDFNNKTVYDLNETDDPWHRTNYYNDRFYMTEIAEENIPQENIINYLTVPKADDIRSFLDMTPDIHAALQPQIRLFKVYFDNGDDKYKTHELPFPSSMSKSRVDNLFRPSNDIDRGEGLGIKEFSFTFDGETPATATNYVNAKLVLFFQSFSDLVKERTIEQDGISYTFRYLDLFVNTKFCPRAGEKAFSPLYYDPSFFRLRADVGWAPRDNDAQFDSILRERGFTKKGFMTALSKTNKTFYLNLVDHNIDIAQDGTVTITADYIAYIEGMLSSNKLNALTTRNIQSAQDYWVKKYECVLKEGKCGEERKRRLRNAINALSAAGSKALKRRIVSDLITNGKLYTVNIDKPRLNDFRRQDFFQETPRLSSRITEVGQAPEPGTPNSNPTLEESWTFINNAYIQDTNYQNNSRIHFFYFADLVYLILDCLYDENGQYLPEVENIKILLTSFVITDPFRGDVRVNMGQIPVDLETFTSWYDDQIIKKDNDNLSVIDFVKRFLFYLVANVFNESCINQDSVKRLMFQSSNIMSVNDSVGSANPFETELDPIIDAKSMYQAGSLPLPTAVPGQRNATTENFYSYLTLFSYYRDSFHSGRGNRIHDENEGIYHLDIGARKGLVKKVSFSKTDIENLRESRMFSQGANGLLQLSSVYRCTIDMIGNTLLYPGMEVWLNPFGLGGMGFGLPQNGPGLSTDPNLSNIMGIGGYQQVLKTTSTIKPGSFTTTVDAHFIYSGEEDGLTNKNGKPISTCERITGINETDIRPAQCSQLVQQAQEDLRELALYGTWTPPEDVDGDCND